MNARAPRAAPADPGSDAERDRALAAAVDGYLESLRRGERIAVDEWARRFPAIERELAESLGALRLLGGAASSAGEAPSIEGYELSEPIGRGGMGVVWRATELATRRAVAVKVIAPALVASPRARARFQREVELAAALEHPSIARVLASGESDGRLWYAMELVDGVPLARWLADQDPGVERRVELMCEVCDAVHYAHLRAVVHRDLKPGNVMVDRAGHPRLLDFGLARGLRDDAVERGSSGALTLEGQLVGTLPYFSPEQASGAAREVDLRSDVYALGVMLYEILAGRPPYPTGGSLAEALHHICHTVPARPSHFRRELRSDIDSVALKALEKSKEARYQTAGELAEELRRYLRREPVEAHRGSHFYLLRKAYARHRRKVQVLTAALAVLLAASATILALYLQVLRERDQLAERNREALRRQALAHLAAGHDHLAEELLQRAYAERDDRGAHWSMLSFLVQNPLRAVASGTGWVTSLAYSADGARLAQGNTDGRVRILDGESLALAVDVAAHTRAVRALDFAPDARRVASGGDDGRIALIDSATGAIERTVDAHAGAVSQVRFVDGGATLLSAGTDGRVIAWNAADLARSRVLAASAAADRPPVFDAAPGGELVAIAAGEAEVRVTSLDPARAAVDRALACGLIEALALDPVAPRIATWGDGRVALWDLERCALVWSRDAGLTEPRPVSLWEFEASELARPESKRVAWRPALVFSRDGALLACSGWDATVAVMTPKDGSVLATLRAHGTAVYALDFRADRRVLASGDVGGVRAWDLDLHPGLMHWKVEPGACAVPVAISREADSIAWAGSSDGGVTTVSISSRAIEREWSAGSSAVLALEFDASGTALATGDETGRVALWSARDGSPLRSWTAPSEVRALRFSPGGDAVATGGRDGRVRVWGLDGSLEREWLAHAGPVLALRLSPRGDLVVSCGSDWRAKTWRVADGSLVGAWLHREWVLDAAFTSDGERLATASADLLLRVGAPEDEPAVWPQTHAHWITGVAFLDRDRVLASAGYDGALRFWDAESGAQLASLPCIGGPVHSLACSSDGKLVVLGASRAVQLVDLGAAEVMLAATARARAASGSAR